MTNVKRGPDTHDTPESSLDGARHNISWVFRLASCEANQLGSSYTEKQRPAIEDRRGISSACRLEFETLCFSDVIKLNRGMDALICVQVSEMRMALRF